MKCDTCGLDANNNKAVWKNNTMRMYCKDCLIDALWRGTLGIHEDNQPTLRDQVALAVLPSIVSSNDIDGCGADEEVWEYHIRYAFIYADEFMRRRVHAPTRQEATKTHQNGTPGARAG